MHDCTTYSSLPPLRVERADARGDHVGAPDGLDLLQAPELVVVEDLVKVLKDRRYTLLRRALTYVHALLDQRIKLSCEFFFDLLDLLC